MDQFVINLSPEAEVNRRIENAILKNLSMLEYARELNLTNLVIDLDANGLEQLQNFTQTNFIEAINQLQSLKSLAAFIFSGISQENFRKIDINLESVKTNSAMVCLFSCRTLTSLEMLWDPKLNLNAKAAALEFWSQQDNLKEFRLGDTEEESIREDETYDSHNYHNNRDYGYDFFSTPNFDDYVSRFNLEIFTFKCTTLYFRRHQELIEFLDMQAKTLKTLSLSLHAESLRAMELIQNYVLENLSKLTSLEFFMNVQQYYRPDFLTTLNDVPRHATNVTNNITYLGFKGAHRTLEEKKSFFDKFTNLKHLYLRAYFVEDFELLNYISTTRTGIETLKLDKFDSYFNNMPRVFFPHLKSITVTVMPFERERIFYEFVLKHQETLEEIKIGINTTSESTIDAIAKCRNLRYLALHSDGINTNHGYLRSRMEILKDVPFDLPRLTVNYENVKFKFPDDQRFWEKVFPKSDTPNLGMVFAMHLVGFTLSFKALRMIYSYWKRN